MRSSSQPKLILLAGPAGSGKTESCIREFESALMVPIFPDGPGSAPRSSRGLISKEITGAALANDIFFLLPTAEHRSRIVDLILRRDVPGFFHTRITTFDRLMNDFLNLGGFDFATDVTRRLILKNIFSRLEFQYFSDLRQAPGFLDLIGEFIIELKEFLVTPGDFRKTAKLLAGRFPDFKLKYEDLSAIYAAYEEALKDRGLVDRRDSIRLLEEGIKRGEISPPKIANIWIDGFSDFSKLQISFIEFLARHADQVTLTLTLDSNPARHSLFETISETQAALEDLGFRLQWTDGKNYRTADSALQHLEKDLFGPAKSVAKSNSSIRIFEAANVVGEVEMIAREIKRLCRGHSCYFSDVAVILRHVDPYASVIQSVFRRFEIPVELHERFRLSASPVARTVLSFLEIILGGWKRKDLFNFLKSSYASCDPQLISDIELAALARGIYGGRENWLREFPGVQQIDHLAEFEDRFQKIKSAREFSLWLKKMIGHFGLFRFSDVLDEKTRRDRESARRILGLLEELEFKKASGPLGALGPDPKQIAEQFIALVEVDLYVIHSRDKNKVQVYDVTLGRQKEYKAVFLAGLLEKQFPVQVKENPVLSDAERRAINERGEVLKERLPRQSFERYLFYMAVTRAANHLILSYPQFNAEGRETLPSFYVDEVKRLFGGAVATKREHISDVLPGWNELETVEEAEKYTIHDLWAIPGGRREEADDRRAMAVYNWLIRSESFKRLVQRIPVPLEGIISDAKVRNAFQAGKRSWSPTQLEEYSECPFRYFSHQLLKFESQSEGIDIRRRGTILHDVLESFFTWQRDKKCGKAGFEEARDFCMARFDELWAEEPLVGDRFYKIELERRRMRELITDILELELLERKPPLPGLVPARFEYKFTGLEIKSENCSFRLTGKIDRIDVDASGAYGLVIDYKAGKPFKMDKLENGTALQLPFYLIAIQKELGLKPLGGHLYSLAKAYSTGFHHKENLEAVHISTRKGENLSAADFDQVLRRAVRFAGKFIEGIEAAKIPVRPRDCVPYCPFSAVCRIEKWRLAHIYREIREEDEKSQQALRV